MGVDENYVVVIVSRLRWDCNGRLTQNRGAGEAIYAFTRGLGIAVRQQGGVKTPPYK